MGRGGHGVRLYDSTGIIERGSMRAGLEEFDALVMFQLPRFLQFLFLIQLIFRTVDKDDL